MSSLFLFLLLSLLSSLILLLLFLALVIRVVVPVVVVVAAAAVVVLRLMIMFVIVLALPPPAAGRAVPTHPLDGELACGLVLVHRPEPVALDLLEVRDVVLPRQQLPWGHWTLEIGHRRATRDHLPSVVLQRVLPLSDTVGWTRVAPAAWTGTAGLVGGRPVSPCQ